VPLTATCPHCGQAGRVPDELAGKTVRCPECKEPFQAAGIPEVIPLQPRSRRLVMIFVAGLLAALVIALVGNLLRMNRVFNKANEDINRSLDNANRP
jgi:predicted Zn finger-like uncharacterized protein